MNMKLLIITPLVWLLSGTPLAMAQTRSASPDQKSGGVVTAPNSRNDAKGIEELQAAAQRLREAIQAMAQAPAGPKRTDAIKAGNRALAETQTAMVSLPPELLTAGANESDYQKAMDKLQQAAQRLRDATHALASEPAGERRNAAIKATNKALLETQQTMIDIPMRISGK